MPGLLFFCGVMDKPHMFTRINGLFYRSITVAHRHLALAGSFRPGRYSRADQPTLYLSASREGVDAAMKAHLRPDEPERVVVTLEVAAERIFDLRDKTACAAAGIDRDKAFAAWQDTVAAGGEAPSWGVAEAIRTLGANGLIDPSRTAPGLWHLVLFNWNTPGGAEVRMRGP